MLKTVGIIMVVLGASGAGFSMAFSVGRSISVAQQFIGALEQMKSEMEYRKTPLPELMRILSVSSKGPASDFFCRVADEMHLGQEISVHAIVKKVLAINCPASISPAVRHVLLNLSGGLGKYDVPGQVRAVDLALTRLGEILSKSMDEQKNRVKSYCTLGICAGLAVAIMVL